MEVIEYMTLKFHHPGEVRQPEDCELFGRKRVSDWVVRNISANGGGVYILWFCLVEKQQ